MSSKNVPFSALTLLIGRQETIWLSDMWKRICNNYPQRFSFRYGSPSWNNSRKECVLHKKCACM